MIIKQDILKKLKSAFDLNEYEVKIWVSLLSRGSAAAGELSDISNVPRSRAYDVLESLEKKGFIIMKVGRPIKYIAVAPKDIISRVKTDVEAQTKETLSNLEKVKDTSSFKEIETLYKTGILGVDPSNISGSFKGRTNILNHIQSLMGEAKKEVVIVTTDDGLVKKMKHFKSTLTKLKQKNVAVNVYAPLESEKAQKAVVEAKNYVNVNKVNLNSRFVVVDNEDVVFMVNSTDVDHTADVGIWVKTPFFANTLKGMVSNFNEVK